MPEPDDELARLIDRFHRAYPGRIEVLPDGAEVTIANNGLTMKRQLIRQTAVSFQWDGGVVRHGTLRLGLLFDGQPSIVVAVERDREHKLYRVPVDHIISHNEHSP